MQIGINPRMTAASGVFDILGPEVLITHCTSTLIFNYRTTGSGTIRVDLLLLDIGEVEVLINEPIASAVIKVSKSNTTFVCLPLVCWNALNVSIGRVKIAVNVPDGVVEVSDVDFLDNSVCGNQSTRKRHLHAWCVGLSVGCHCGLRHCLSRRRALRGSKRLCFVPVHCFMDRPFLSSSSHRARCCSPSSQLESARNYYRLRPVAYVFFSGCGTVLFTFSPLCRASGAHWVGQVSRGQTKPIQYFSEGR